MAQALRVAAELMITLGVVLALFVVYQLVGTGVLTARSQEAASTELDTAWNAPAAPAAAPVAGEPVARLHVPRFGPAWSRVVLEGTDAAVLARGPGHYAGTAQPGERGNVALAGHRVSNGAPFEPADRLRSCDAIVLETRDAWLVYRVLPMPDEVDRWPAVAAVRPECAGVRPLDGAYAGTVGREIVTPAAVEVIAAVPHRPSEAPSLALLTLTTCHPRFSAQQRLVVHAVLVREVARDGVAPPELSGA